MVDFLNNSSQLELLDVDNLFSEVGPLPNFHPPKLLKVIKLSEVYSERFFMPLIIGCKNLTSLQTFGGDVNWDRCFEMIPDGNRLATVHLTRCCVTDAGISSLSKYHHLVELHIESEHCSDVGLISVAENCKGLKTLSVFQGNTWSGIGDQGLIAVGKHSLNLENLVLYAVNATRVSLEVIATNCQKLVTISLSRSERITDLEILCIAEKFLYIRGCAVSDKGIEALGVGCPNLVSLGVTYCRKVTREAVDLLRA